MSNSIGYVVTYDSDINSPSPTYLSPILNIMFGRNIAPTDDTATIVLDGITDIIAAREIYIYRQNSDGTFTLKFRGMSTNPEYLVEGNNVTTTINVNSLFYMLSTRLFQIAGKSPPPLQPNTNPYLVYLNPLLNLNFGEVWVEILVNAFQGSYSTGHLPPIHLANLDSTGVVNSNIPFFTDFDLVVVNDIMNIQYQSISGVIDRLVTSALFNASQDTPFLAEYRLDIGDYPYGFWADTAFPVLPTLTVMLFDPTHSALGNGNNRTGIQLGDNSINNNAKTHSDPTLLDFPMCYVEFGVYNGYDPIDTIIFSEGDNFTSIKLVNDYLVMNNSYVLTGGSFQGSDVVAVPIESQRSIAEFGLKQTNQTLSNVVDQSEIKRYVGTSINFFQHPVPNIVIKPNYIYASTHTLYAGDYILVNAPSLVTKGVVKDSNGNKIMGSYATGNATPVVAAFTARIKTITTTWSPTDGEDITLTLTFPITNVPISQWNAAHNTQQQGSPGGGVQFMYTSVEPAAKTMLGRGRQSEGAAVYQSGSDFISNKSNPYNERITDVASPSLIPDFAPLDVNAFAQVNPNAMDAIVAGPHTNVNADSNVGTSVVHVVSALGFTKGMKIGIGSNTARFEMRYVVSTTLTSITVDTALSFTHTAVQNDPVDGNISVKADDILLYQFGVEVDSPAASSSNQSIIYLTVLQPDGMAIYDGVTNLDQLTNILALISKSHKTPTFSNSAPLLDGISGKYKVIIRNPNAFAWCPNPLFQTMPAPVVTETGYSAGGGPTVYSYYVTPVDANGNEFGISGQGTVFDLTNTITSTNVSWTPVSGAVSYNVYRANFTNDILSFFFLINIAAPTTSTGDVVSVAPDTNYDPYLPTATLNGVAATNSGTALLQTGHTYWYAVTAVNVAGNETLCSAAGSRGKGTVVNGNSNSGTNVIFVANTANFQVGNTVLIGENTFNGGIPRVEAANIVTIVSPTSLTLQNNLAFTHLAAQADWVVPQDIENGTLSSVPQSIEVAWVPVPNAVNYNIYRGDSGSLPARASMLQIQTGVTSTVFLDDGTYDLTAITPPLSTAVSAGNSPYTVYINYSFHQDPSQSTITTSGGSPTNAIVYDPTQRRAYLPHSYPT